MEKWRLEYINKKGDHKVCILTSVQSKCAALNTCRDNDLEIVSIDKLYPFSTNKNQHNFDLISNLCYNRMSDMESGEVEWNDDEYDKLADMKERAEKYFCLELPVAWLTWNQWQDANELAQNAIIHRQNACIENGRPDLVTYC